MNDEKKIITGFDFYRNFVKAKEKHTDAEIEQYYDPLSINRLMSHDKLALPFAAEMNKHPFLIPKKINYLFYFYGVAQRSWTQFLNIKKEKGLMPSKELIEKAKFFLPDYSLKRILEILPFIQEKLEEIKLDQIKGGKRKE